jgi:hypothetical protein
MSKRKNKIRCDLDDSLLETNGDWETAILIKERIKLINKLYDRGWKIIIWSSRDKEDKQETKDQLKKFGVKYNKLKMEKPKYLVLIDNRAVNSNEWYDKFVDEDIEDVENWLETTDFDEVIR